MERTRADAHFDPARLYKLSRSKAYLFAGVEIRWRCDPSLASADVPEQAVFQFPGGLADHLNEQLAERECVTAPPFAGRQDFPDGQGSAEWAVAWPVWSEGASESYYCNTIPTPDGGTHEAGLRAALTKGIRAFADLIGQKKAKDISPEDIVTGSEIMLSLFLRDPQFQSQTKDRLTSPEAARLVENAVRDHFDTWLGQDPKSAGAILDFLVLRAEERLRRRQEKETARKTATKKLRLPGKLVDCSSQTREGTELFIVEGDSAGGSAKMARDRTTQALLPLRGKILNVLGAASSKLGQNTEIHDLCQARGVPVWCGGMHEYGIGRAHNIALSALPNFSIPGDISASDKYYAEDLIDPPVTLEHGKIQVPQTVGLGYAPNEERIARFTVQKLTFT